MGLLRKHEELAMLAMKNTRRAYMKTRYRENEEHARGARVNEGFACAHTEIFFGGATRRARRLIVAERVGCRTRDSG